MNSVRPVALAVGVFVCVAIVPSSASTATPAIPETLARTPITFERNVGQFDRSIDFVSRGPGYSVSITPEAARSALTTEHGAVELTMVLEGADPAAVGSASGAAAQRTNYFRGSDPSRWLTSVPSFHRVRYDGVYDGIGIEYFGRGGLLEYDFLVGPGADPGLISLHFEGARAVCVDERGTLVIDTPAGELRHLQPYAYQTSRDGSRQRVAAEFDVAGGRVGFAVGDYDRSRELVIDPSVVYSHDLFVDDLNVRAIAVDGSGNVILTGQNRVVGLPAVNAIRPTLSGGGSNWEYEGFVMKLSPLGAILYSTYLGGDGEDDSISVAVDGSGNAYLVGRTRSTDFPTTAGAYQRSLSLAWTTIQWDLFVTKLSPAGALVYSTYLGGEGGEEPKDVALGTDGSVYVAGYLDSGSFPITVENRPQMEENSDHGGFVTRLSADGGSLIYSTVLPVSSDARAIEVNASGAAYITGSAFSSRHYSFPTTAGAFAPLCTITDRDGYCRDAFVMKLDAAGALELSTFLPGLENETGKGIALDSAGNVHVVGETLSGDFPVTADAFQREKWADGIYDGFYVKLDGSLSTLLYGTFLGGDHWDDSTDVVIDSLDRVTVKGDASDGFAFVNPFLYTASDGPTGTVLTQFNSSDQVQFSVGFPIYSAFKFAADSGGNLYVFFGNNRLRKINPTGSSTDLILSGVGPRGRSNIPSDSFEVYCEAGEFDSGSSVLFGSSPATNVTLDNWPRTLRGNVPLLGAGLYDVSVSTASGKSGSFPRGYEVVSGTFSIGSISPATVAAGSRAIVTINGAGIPPNSDVTFGGPSPTVATYSVRSHRLSGTTLQAFVPYDLPAGVYNVNVLPNGSTFSQITLPGALTVTGPRVYGLDPPVAMSNGGASLNVEAPYEDVFNGTTVSFDGTPGTMGTYHSSGVYVTVPAHPPGRVDVQVNTPLGTVMLPDGFLYLQSISVDTVSPINGPPAGGTGITVTGSGFVSGARVTIDGLLIDDAIVVNSTTITGTTPPRPPGVVTIGVRNPDGGYGELRNDWLVANDQFTYDGPAPSSVSVRTGFPNAGQNFAPATGGTGVRVDGAGFAAGARVFFGAQEATVTLVTPPGSIEATTPAHPEGLADLIVMNPTGETGRKDRSFIFTGAAHTITGISPAAGPTSGGTAVTITGTGIPVNARVTIGGMALLNPVISSTSITGTTARGAEGAAEVRVWNPVDQQVATTTFTYVAPPLVQSVCVSPETSCSSASGPVTGGTVVIIRGESFSNGAVVNFGGVAATSVVVNSAFQITCTTPAHAQGYVDVTVVNIDGQNGTKTSAFRYLPGAPTITSFTPASAPPAVSVTITGTNFVNVTSVKFFNNKTASYTVDSATQITAVVPAGAATGAITVTTDSGTATSASFTVESAGPQVTSFTPTSGAGGTSVVITGLRFTNANLVQFGGVNASSFTINSDTQITATVPATVVTGKVCVGNPDGTGCSAGDFTAGPRITSFSPASGVPGATITINGANFQGATQVGFTGGATAAPATVAGTGASLTVIVPAAATTGTVSVTTPAGTVTSTAVFTVPPVITSFSPAGGGPGTVVTINGARFTGATNVTFNGAAATFTVVSSTVITATVPQAFAAAGKIVVTTPSGSATSAANFTTGPRITFVTPGYGLVGASITIDGATFTGATQVRFNGVAATFTIVSDTRITTTVPAGATSGPVSITGPSGTGTSTNPFYLPPAITSFNPPSGYAGSTVIITGQNFLGTTNVTFNNVVSSFVVDSNTQITATVPGSAGTGPIRVHGFAATATGSTFTITAAPPPVLTAAAASATSVNVGWTGVAQQYDVQRSTNNSSWQNLARITAVSYTDNTALANTVYFYRVVRVSGGATSNSDLATTIIFTDDPLVAGSTAIKAIHIEQLRTAINLVRASAGLGAATWTDGSLAGVPVKAVHFTEMRTALSAAVQNLTGSPLAFTDPSLAGIAAKAVHLQELRNPIK